MKRILTFLTFDMRKEYENIRFWSIITFVVGILCCFFTHEPTRTIIIAFVILSIAVVAVCMLQIDSNGTFFCKIILKFLIMFSIGFGVAMHKCSITEKNDFKQGIHDITIDGIVKGVKLTPQDTILTIEVVKSPLTSIQNKKINIKYNNEVNFSGVDDIMNDTTNIKPNNKLSTVNSINIVKKKIDSALSDGDLVRINTSLSARRYRYFPKDKSYENYAKFFESIALGRAKSVEILRKGVDIDTSDTSKIVVVKEEKEREKEEEGKSSGSSRFKKFLERFNTQNKRNAIQQRIYEVNNHSVGSGIVIALLTGNNSFIPKDKLANIRHSGCAHILAISGLHMSIVVGFVLAFFIHFFALFPSIALKYNVKKLAIMPAIFACLFYLRIADAPISALRSFIMVSIGAIVLLANRSRSSLNVLFVTLFIMLCMEPNNILSPSFQMSFMAVFGLVSIYNNNAITENSIFSKRRSTFRYMCGVLSSSIVATISTVFFEIYHFKQYAWIGLVSNIPVIPLTEFVVLPIGFIGMIFNGTYIGDTFYIISGFFANIVSIIVDFTANLPYSFLLTKQMSNTQLAIIIAGIVIVFLSRAIILRIIGLSLFVVGFSLYLFEPKIMLVYSRNFKNIVFHENGEYYSIEPIKSEFIQSVWSQNLGIEEIKAMTKSSKLMRCYNVNNGDRVDNDATSQNTTTIHDDTRPDDIYKFDDKYCIYTHNDTQIIFVFVDNADRDKILSTRTETELVDYSVYKINSISNRERKESYIIVKDKYKNTPIAIKFKGNSLELSGCDDRKG